jgi:hypothetical protein
MLLIVTVVSLPARWFGKTHYSYADAAFYKKSASASVDTVTSITHRVLSLRVCCIFCRRRALKGDELPDIDAPSLWCISQLPDLD